MAQPDIQATYRTGSGYLSTTFSDPTDWVITHRKWDFGDGVILEGSSLQTINHTYYYPGIYDVILVAQTATDQITVTRKSFIVVDTYLPIPDFILSQSFDGSTGNYWRFYFDQYFHLVFEDNYTVYRSKDKVAQAGKWLFIDFDRSSGKMRLGSYSYYVKEIEVIKYDNTNPISFSGTWTDIAPNSTLKMDEFKIWSISKDATLDYTQNRGRAGYLNSL